jgi:mono/diheme cytochrome c family protein
MNIQNRVRFSLLLCLIFCTGTGLSSAQDNVAVDASATLTLEQLKAEGAARSRYRQQNGAPSAVKGTQTKDTVAEFEQLIKPVLKEACVQCHGLDHVEGNIRIDTLNPDLVNGPDSHWWLEVQAVLSNGEMPPPDAKGLKDTDRAKVVEWLADEIQRASKIRRETGGHSSFRRLTRYEYNYALQDLLGVKWNFARDLPPESHSDDGFQNSSELLHMSVGQLESYRQIALTALRRVTVRGVRPPVIYWGVSMKEAADREWPKQQEQLAKAKEQFKDDPVKLQQEVDRLTASFKQPHDRPHYRELSSGNTARAAWDYGGAKYAFGPEGTEPKFPETFDHVAVIPSGRNQELTVELGDTIPDEGIMRVRVRASKEAAEENRVPSLQLEFGFQASNEGRAEIRVSTADTPITATADAPAIYEWDVPLGEIYPRNAFRRESKMGDLPSPSEYIRFINSSVPQGGHGAIQIDYVQVLAPFYDEWPSRTHKQIFFDSEHRADEAIYAKEVLTQFMTRAWRRDLSDEEIQQKLKLFHAIRGQCDSFEEAMLEVLAAVLSSPKFLYVVHEDGEAGKESAGGSSGAARLSSEELASRLSLFLWCSIPDETLRKRASSGELTDAGILRQEVDRMLQDPRAERFADQFVHQWLDMQLLDFLTLKNAEPELKESMQKEPVAFFHEMLRHDESVLNFIHADYMMADERLAVHCGLPDVRGNSFRRAALNGTQHRGGLLTQSGLMAMNSNGSDSHPLKRGVWLLKSVLNDPPPPPPAAVPIIDLADPEIMKMTLKQRIENHRNQAACFSCHAKIDPWGIAFENYDALGRWRDKVNGVPVDASSLLFNQQELKGADGLKRFLLQNRQDQFVRAMVHKLATFALGRPLTFSDHADIDGIAADVRQQGDGLATMISCIVASELFQTK